MTSTQKFILTSTLVVSAGECGFVPHFVSILFLVALLFDFFNTIIDEA